MADTQPLAPTDAEIVAVMRDGYNCRYNDEADHIDFARAVLAKWGAQPVVRRAPTAAFDDTRVRVVHEILCDDTDWPPKETPQQHWEGWIARRIVERLFQEPEEGANAHDMRYAHGEVAERCEDVKRAMDVVVELERRGMLEAQPVVREPLTPERVKAMVLENGYGYTYTPDSERAAFVDGIRHGEAAHGIT